MPAQVLGAAERTGELKDPGYATVRSFASCVLRRGVHDAAAVAQTAHRLADFPKLAEAYRAGWCTPRHDPNMPGHAAQLLAEIGGWADSPYRHGGWGWTGPDPAPPPGHAPPQPFED